MIAAAVTGRGFFAVKIRKKRKKIPGPVGPVKAKE